MFVAEPLERWTAPPDFAQVVGATSQKLEAIETFRAMLCEANAEFNLVGGSTLADFWSRHFVDSAQLLWFDPEALVWADLGSGAGLPGIILAILLKDRSGAQVHLIESMTKRCRFLSAAVERLDLPAQVHNVRAESLNLKVDVVTARACAPLDRLLSFSHGYFERGARGLFLKGSEVQAEISAAKTAWRFDAEVFGSLSDPRGQIVAIPHLAAKRRSSAKARS